jgi:hypothetical protein
VAAAVGGEASGGLPGGGVEAAEGVERLEPLPADYSGEYASQLAEARANVGKIEVQLKRVESGVWNPLRGGIDAGLDRLLELQRPGSLRASLDAERSRVEGIERAARKELAREAAGRVDDPWARVTPSFRRRYFAAEAERGAGRSGRVEVRVVPTGGGAPVVAGRVDPGQGDPARREAANRVWLDVLAGQAPGLLGGLSAADLPMRSIDELPMRGSDYVPPDERPAPPRRGQAAVEAAAAEAAARDRRRRPRADLERGAVPERQGDRLLPVGPADGEAAELVGLKGVRWRDEIVRRQAELWEERQQWKGVNIGHGRVVDPKMAREGLASAGSSADRVWLDVMAGRPPGLLGGLAAGEVPMKPAAVTASAAGGYSGGAATAAAADGAVGSLEKLRKAAEDLALRLGMVGGPVPPALPARPGGWGGRLWSGE